MAQTFSLAIVIGNLGADPEIRTGQDGHRVALFRLATDSQRTDTTTGRRVPQTVWHRVVCHNDFLTDLLEQRARKGQLVFVRGSYEVRARTDQGPPEPEIVVSAQDGDVKILFDPGR
ncbi:single-stranded DNA-binding protein [Gluconobacter sp. OJB]|uniref:single-stranded DNA-binding protein n=1 Tax=unclassified Gluconobacter TaxID=2644261 RepID=UPI0031FA298A